VLLPFVRVQRDGDSRGEALVRADGPATLPGPHHTGGPRRPDRRRVQ
jgi:hypothetical protein